VRVLFAMRHAGYSRLFASTLRELCVRGHEVDVLFGRSTKRADDSSGALVARLTDELPGLRAHPGLEARFSTARQPADVQGGFLLHNWLDYLQYFRPELAAASKLRSRVASALPLDLRSATEVLAASPAGLGQLVAALEAVERELPVPAEIVGYLEETRPDAVLVSPLLERGVPQLAYLRAAETVGIPSAVCVASWDNLTTSTRLYGSPDAVMVWNDAQRSEAVSIHGVPPERVVVTGAPVMDEWFAHAPSSSRAEFLASVGLQSERPYLLYVCSSAFIAPNEWQWITRWLRAVRRSGHQELAEIPVLVRPHPQNPVADGSPAADHLAATSGLVVSPRNGQHVIDEDALSRYYDAIHHAAAVVGVNTSAMIESAIVGRGVHVLLTKRYRGTQLDAPHFSHLQQAGGGLVRATAKVNRHCDGLAGAIRGDDAEEVAERSPRFLKAFVRPRGLDRPATPILADAIERLAEGCSRRPSAKAVGH
jgi:hypothetical protein